VSTKKKSKSEEKKHRTNNALDWKREPGPVRLMPMCDGNTEAKLRRWGIIS
jgi:hypothetical protein